MRKQLKQINGRRKRFSAVFERYGSKTNWHGFPEPTILFTDVKDSDGKFVASHIWFNLTKGFNALTPWEKGDRVEFDARVKDYEKGYVNHREFIDERTTDYKLNNPTKIRKVQDEKADD